MSHFFLRSKHYLLFVPLFLTTLSGWVAQATYGQRIQEWGQEIQDGGDFDFSGFNLADYNGYFYAFIAMILLALVTQVGWYRAVGQDLKRYLPDHTSLNDNTFKATLILQVASSLLMVGFMWYGWNWVGANIPTWIENDGMSPEGGKEMLMSALKMAGLFVAIALIGFLAQVYNCYFAGKTLKTIEEGRSAKGGEIVGYVILSYFLVLGVWIMQPKVNRLVETGSMAKAGNDGVW
ncbi:MAG: hypothetical protein OTI34_10685 [Lewinella sp.]|nr:hypothetical protein [Lewinella sp.]